MDTRLEWRKKMMVDALKGGVLFKGSLIQESGGWGMVVFEVRS